jgi:ATP-dependent Clp protease ATP-binding subunit ClpX
LRGILEDVMLDIMYDLPEQEDGTVFTIDENVVAGSSDLFKMPTTKSA